MFLTCKERWEFLIFSETMSDARNTRDLFFLSDFAKNSRTTVNAFSAQSRFSKLPLLPKSIVVEQDMKIEFQHPAV